MAETDGGEPGWFWPRLISLFVCDGILFENFHSDGHESEFTRRIIRPAFAEVEERYGVRPLIVPLLPITWERDPYWSWYPSRWKARSHQAFAPPPALPLRQPDFVPLPLAALGGRHG